MMTPILPSTVTTRRSYAQLLIGIALGCILTLAAIPGTLTAQPEVMEHLRAACRFPDRDGAATVWARADGKIFCWEML